MGRVGSDVAAAEQQYGETYTETGMYVYYISPPNCMGREEFTAQRVNYKAAGKGIQRQKMKQMMEGKNPS